VFSVLIQPQFAGQDQVPKISQEVAGVDVNFSPSDHFPRRYNLYIKHGSLVCNHQHSFTTVHQERLTMVFCCSSSIVSRQLS